MPNQYLPLISASNIMPPVNVNFEHMSDYKKAESALEDIKDTKSGKLLLTELTKLLHSDKKILIVVSPNYTSSNTGYLTRSQCQRYGISEDLHDKNHRNAVKVLSSSSEAIPKNEGVSTIITYNPKESLLIDNLGRPTRVNSPAYAHANLMRELVHAYHNLNGTSLNGPEREIDPEQGGRVKEGERAIGIGKYLDEPFSENSFRMERGYPLRAQYYLSQMRPQ